MKISFIGDVMLGRFISEKYKKKAYDIVAPELVQKVRETDYVIANLESTITSSVEESDDHLVFQGNPQILQNFSWVDCFSLSNNHINDCGTEGMNQTVESLEKCNIGWNGLFKGGIYIPYLINKDDLNIAIITCCDMMNVEFSQDNDWKTIRIDDPILDETIIKYKSLGYFVILYAHVGVLFTRFPNPPIREFCHTKIDLGTDLVITAHPHVVGGHETYKDKNIFYSLGDFVMDGSSFRRRRSIVLQLEIKDYKLAKWQIIPAEINDQLQTSMADQSVSNSILKNFFFTGDKLKSNMENYSSFYNKQYKLEILQHSISTIKFILKKKGLNSLFRLLFKRADAVLGMGKRVFTDRSSMRYDADAVNPHKHVSNKDIQ